MKKLVLILVVCFAINITSHSQTMEGTYTNTWESTAGGALTYTITLNPDNTFVFESHRIFETSIPSKVTTIEGTWKNKNRLLILLTDPSKDDKELVKKLHNNKAKFKAYSPRHRKYKNAKPSLKFYKSQVFYAKGMKLEKKTSDSVTSNS